MTKDEMVSEFQCLGCVNVSNPASKKCAAYVLDESYGFKCAGHVLGTSFSGQIKFALGLPKGFNRACPRDDNLCIRNTLQLCLWLKGTAPVFDMLNVAVWALVPRALDVASFIEEID